MFAKFVVREMSPIPMVSIRYTIVALTLFAMLAWRGEKLLPPRRTWPALFTMGILGVCINNVTQIYRAAIFDSHQLYHYRHTHAHRDGSAQLCADP